MSRRRVEGGERRSRRRAWPADDAERSVSGVEQRDICDSKCGFAALLMGRCGGRSRRVRFGFQSRAFCKQ